MKVFLRDKRVEMEEVTTFLLEAEPPVSWRAGQYGVYTIDLAEGDDRGNQRFFTIASAPYEGHLQITTRLMGSAFKKGLDGLAIGDSFELKQVGGNFVIDDPEKNYVFIAGGIGITPFRSILLDLAYRELPINVTLLYAHRGEVAVFKDELERVAVEHPSLIIHHIIDPERIDADHIKKFVQDLSTPEFYVSGPEPMVKGMEQVLEGLGVERDKIKRDYFPGYSEDH